MNNQLMKHGLIDLFLLGALILGCASQPSHKLVNHAAPLPNKSASMITLDKISEGYEVVVMLLLKDQIDLLLPITVEEVAKKIFLRQEHNKFAPENVLVIPTSDPANIAYAKQFIYKSKGVFTSAELVDEEAMIIECGSKNEKKDFYIRLLLVKQTTPKLKQSKAELKEY